MEKHHWISQTYLRNFSPDKYPGQIYELSRFDKKSVLKSIKKGVAFDYDYNTIEVDGEKKYDYEKIISELERIVSKVFKKIKLHRFKLTDDEVSYLLYFMVYIRLNVPQFRKGVNKFEEDVFRKIIKISISDKQKVKKILEQIDLKDIDKSKIDVDEIVSFAQDESRYIVKVPREIALFQGIKQHENLFKIFAHMNWIFLVIEDDSYFITTDMPVIQSCKDWRYPYAPGYGIADNIIFPITKKICLLGHRESNTIREQINKIKGSAVNAINLTLMEFSDVHLYSPISLKDLNEQIRKFPIE